MINRRNLCQAPAALALAGLSNPFQKLAAAGPIAIRLSGALGGRVHEAKQKLRICILRLQLHDAFETFLRQAGDPLRDADIAEITLVGRA